MTAHSPQPGPLDFGWRANRPPLGEFLRPAKLRNAVRRRRFELTLSHMPVEGGQPVQWLGRRDYGGYWVPLQLVRPDWVVYSLGAGMEISFDLALIEGAGCDVHCFDPARESARYVESLGNPKLHMHRVAVWNYDGDLEMYRAATPGHAALSAANLQNTRTTVTVPCRSIDSLMREAGHDHIDLLKFHVEGAEYDVFESAALRRWNVQVLIINLFHTGSVLEARWLLRRIRRQGYRAVALHETSFTFTRDA